MKISKVDIDAIKRSLDLVAVMKKHGIVLKKVGKQLMGKCPFHSDKKASMSVNPEKGLWHCFGCDAGGDDLGFLSKIENKSLPVLLRELAPKTNGNGSRPSSCQPANGNGSGPHSNVQPATLNGKIQDTPKLVAQPDAPLSPKLLKLLSRVVEFYQGIFEKDPKGREYLSGRGIQDKDALRDFGVGYANGSLLDALPPEGDLLADLKAIGILTERGYEFFSDCIVIPLRDLSGSVTGLYGRRITDSEPHHLYLPGPRRGLINWQAAKRSSTILITEAIIDALTLYGQGFKNVIPCYGVTGLSEEHLTCFKQFEVKEVMICFDADEAGKRGAAIAVNRLAELGISCSVITLPDKDVNDYFRRHTPEEFEALVKDAHPLTPIRSEAIVSRAESFFETTDAGFKIGLGDRVYEVKGIHRQGVQLRITLLVTRESRIHLDAVDLYLARARERFSKDAASALKEREELIRDDLMRILSKIEKQEKTTAKETVEAPTPQIEEAARKFLCNPNLFDELLSDLDTLGLLGEEINKQIGYLACTSRKLDKPLSVLVQSRSSAGKSAYIEALLLLLPPEDVKRWTRLTDQALFYQSEMALVHKLVVIEEMAGMSGAAYSIRSLQSSGRLSLASVMKDPASGQMKSREQMVQGPSGFLMSTAGTQMDEETKSRFLTVGMDESEALTARILARQREDLTIEGYFRKKKRDVIINKHQAAQRMLKEIVVIDPLPTAYPFGSVALWARRDQPKVLSLLRAIALLFQYQREVKTGIDEETGEVIEYIEAGGSDWKQAEPLIAYLMESAQSELPVQSRDLYAKIKVMAKDRLLGLAVSSGEISFTHRDLCELAGWSLWQVKTYLRPLVEHEYIWVRQGKKGQEYRYELPQ